MYPRKDDVHVSSLSGCLAMVYFYTVAWLLQTPPHFWLDYFVCFGSVALGLFDWLVGFGFGAFVMTIDLKDQSNPGFKWTLRLVKLQVS